MSRHHRILCGYEKSGLECRQHIQHEYKTRPHFVSRDMAERERKREREREREHLIEFKQYFMCIFTQKQIFIRWLNFKTNVHVYFKICCYLKVLCLICVTMPDILILQPAICNQLDDLQLLCNTPPPGPTSIYDLEILLIIFVHCCWCIIQNNAILRNGIIKYTSVCTKEVKNISQYM